MTNAKTAIILVHGIGDQARRATIREFTRTLSRVALMPPGQQQGYREPGTADPEFGYFVSEGTIGDSPAVIAECYWADLSQMHRGFLSALRNFFQFIVDAPDIIYSCLGPRVVGEASRDYLVLRGLRAILALALWLVYFPVVAVNVAYAAYVMGFALHARWVPGVTPGSAASTTIIVTSGVAAAIVLLVSCQRRFSPYFRALAIMTLAIFLAAVSFVLWEQRNPSGLITYRTLAAAFNGGLNLLWLAVLVSGFVYLALMPLLLPFFWQRRRAIVLGFAAMFLVCRFWLLLITTIWLIFLNSVFDPQTYKSLLTDIGGPIRFISLLWLDLALTGLVLLAALAMHMLHTWRSRAGVQQAGYPRLVVPASVLILAPALQVAGLAAVCWCNCAMFWPGCPQPACDLIYGPSEWIIANAALLLGVGGLVVQLGQGHFKIALDIVNWFKSDRGHRCINPLEAMTSVLFYKPEEAEMFRVKVRARLDALIDDLSRTAGPFERTILVAHSLGSMIAIGALRGGERHGDVGRLELITLGSPYSSIFAHYFPHIFPAAGPALLPGVAAWTNIYRENDYVGTTLTDGRCGVAEVRHPALGHLDYLRHDGVVAEVVGRVFGASIVARQADHPA